MNLERMIVGHRAGDRLGGFPRQHCPFCGSAYHVVLTEEEYFPHRVKMAGQCEECGAGSLDFTTDIMSAKDLSIERLLRRLLDTTFSREDLFDARVVARLMEE